MRICPNCRNQFDDTYNVCPFCGTIMTAYGESNTYKTKKNRTKYIVVGIILVVIVITMGIGGLAINKLLSDDKDERITKEKSKKPKVDINVDSKELTPIEKEFSGFISDKELLMIGKKSKEGTLSFSDLKPIFESDVMREEFNQQVEDSEGFYSNISYLIPNDKTLVYCYYLSDYVDKEDMRVDLEANRQSGLNAVKTTAKSFEDLGVVNPVVGFQYFASDGTMLYELYSNEE